MQKIICPKCGSENIKYVGGKGVVFLMGIGSLSFGLLFMLIPFIGIPLAVIGLVLMVVTPFVKKVAKCEACGNVIKIPKEIIKEK